MRCQKLSLGWILFSIAVLVPVHSAEGYQISLPPEYATDQSIAPGAEGAIGFDVQFEEFEPEQALVAGWHLSHADAFSEYEFVPEDPAVCLPPYTEHLSIPRIVFPVNKPQGTLLAQCHYRVLRESSSQHDLRFHICPPWTIVGNCEPIIRLGSLPDLTLQTRPVGTTRPGDMSATVEIVVRNPTARDVSSRPLATSCSSFGSDFASTPFTIHTDFPGACEVTGGADCGFTFGFPLSSLGFDPGPVPAGGSASCLVRLQMREPASEAHWISLRFLSDRVLFADGATGYDPTNPWVRLGVAPSVAPLVVPFSPLTVWVLGTLIIGLGCARLRRG